MRNGGITAVALSLLCSAGCSCEAVSGTSVARDNRPPGLSDTQWHRQLSDLGYSFWERNDDKPFSLIPCYLEGLRQIAE